MKPNPLEGDPRARGYKQPTIEVKNYGGGFGPDLAQVMVTGVVSGPYDLYVSLRRRNGERKIPKKKTHKNTPDEPALGQIAASGLPTLSVRSHPDGKGKLSIQSEPATEPIDLKEHPIDVVAVSPELLERLKGIATTPEGHMKMLRRLGSVRKPEGYAEIGKVVKGEKPDHDIEAGVTVVASDPRNQRELVHFTVKEDGKVEEEIVNQVHHARIEPRHDGQRLTTRPVYFRDWTGSDGTFHDLEIRFPTEKVDGYSLDSKRRVNIIDEPAPGKNVLLVGDPERDPITPDEASLMPQIPMYISRNGDGYKLNLSDPDGLTGAYRIANPEGEYGEAVKLSPEVQAGKDKLRRLPGVKVTRLKLPLNDGRIQFMSNAGTPYARDEMTIQADISGERPCIVIVGPDPGAYEKEGSRVTLTFEEGKKVKARLNAEAESNKRKAQKAQNTTRTYKPDPFNRLTK